MNVFLCGHLAATSASGHDFLAAFGDRRKVSGSLVSATAFPRADLGSRLSCPNSKSPHLHLSPPASPAVMPCPACLLESPDVTASGPRSSLRPASSAPALWVLSCQPCSSEESPSSWHFLHQLVTRKFPQFDSRSFIFFLGNCMSVALALSSKQMWVDLIASDIRCVSYPDGLVLSHLPRSARQSFTFWQERGKLVLGQVYHSHFHVGPRASTPFSIT